MNKTFIVSKTSLKFEVAIDGKIEVKPLPHASFSDETVKVLAQVHTVCIHSSLIKHKEQNFVDLAVKYFEGKGFEVKEK